MTNVVKFPDKMAKEFAPENEVSATVMKSMIESMVHMGYMPHTDLPLQKDLGLVYHILFAAVCRAHGKPHPFHTTMEEIMDELSANSVDPDPEV